MTIFLSFIAQYSFFLLLLVSQIIFYDTVFTLKIVRFRSNSFSLALEIRFKKTTLAAFFKKDFLSFTDK